MPSKKHTNPLPTFVSPVRRKGKITGYKYQRRIPKSLQRFYPKQNGNGDQQTWDLYLGDDLLQAIVKAHQLAQKHDAQIAATKDPESLAQAELRGLEAVAAENISNGSPKSPRWQDAGDVLELASSFPPAMERETLAVFAATAFNDRSYTEAMILSPIHAALAESTPAAPPHTSSETLLFEALKTAITARLAELDATKTVPEDERLSRRLEEYIRFNSTADSTARSYRTRVNRFIDFLGDDRALTAVTDDDIRRYRDFLRAGSDDHPPMEVSGVQQYINVLNALYRWAIDEKKATANPVSGVRALRNDKSVEDTRWVAFTREDMAMIWPALQAEWGPDSRSKLSIERRTVFLSVFRLLLWTGMRPNEVFKLDPANVEQTKLHIAKTKTSAARSLPLTSANADFYDLIHSDVWTKALTNQKGIGVLKDPQKIMSENFTRIIRALGITNERKVLYSTKDTMIDALEELGASENIQRTIIGHKTGRQALRNYKEAAKFEAMREVLERIEYCPGLPR